MEKGKDREWKTKSLVGSRRNFYIFLLSRH